MTSFTIPLNDRGYSNYKQVARTLCPDWNKKTGDTQLFLAVDVSSSDVVQVRGRRIERGEWRGGGRGREGGG